MTPYTESQMTPVQMMESEKLLLMEKYPETVVTYFLDCQWPDFSAKDTFKHLRQNTQELSDRVTLPHWKL